MNLIKQKSKITILAFFIVILAGSVFILSSNSGGKGTISAVLQTDIDLSSPSESISAVSTADQQLSDGSVLPRGTKLTGKTSLEGNNLIVFFDTIQTLEGQSQQFIGKLTINKIEDKEASGVSAKLGKTLYNQSKSNVLGAIFYNPGSSKGVSVSVLPKGSVLKIEVD